jgi:hypothetical protein
MDEALILNDEEIILAHARHIRWPARATGAVRPVVIDREGHTSSGYMFRERWYLVHAQWLQ